MTKSKAIARKLMQYLRMQIMELKTGVLGVRFLVSVLLVLLCSIMSFLHLMRETQTTLDASIKMYDICKLELNNAIGGTGTFVLLTFCLFVLPYGGSYAEEYVSGISYMKLGRSGYRTYAWTKITAVAFSSFLCVWVAEALYALFLHLLGFEFVLPGYAGIGSDAEGFTMIAEKKYVPFWIAVVLVRALWAAFLGSIGCMLSGKIHSIHAIVTLPVMMYFVFSNLITEIFKLPDWLNWANIYIGIPNVFGVPMGWDDVSVSIAHTAVAFLLFGCIFQRFMRESLGHSK